MTLWTPLTGSADFTTSGATLYAGYRADQTSEIVIETGTTASVAQWSDYSGNARHLTEYNYFGNFYQALYSSTGLDGTLPAMVPNANGNTGFQIFTGAGITAPIAAFVVAQAPATPNGQRLISFNNPSEADFSHNGGIFLYDENGGTGVQTLGCHSNPVTGGTNHIFCAVQTLTTNANYLDGVLPSGGIDGYTPYSGTWDCLGVGVFASDSQSNSSAWGAPIAEVVLVTGTVTTTLRQIIEGYLAWKWGLQGNLPSGHPYKSAAPTVSGGGGGSVSGTLAATEAADTLAASGQLGVIGSLAATEGSDTFAGAGQLGVIGSLAATDNKDGLAASGTVASVGTWASTEAPDTLAASGTVSAAGSATGSWASTEPTDTFAATGGVVVAGTLAATDNKDGLAASGGVIVAGSWASTEAADTFQASGLLSVFGALAATDAKDGCAITGAILFPITGALAATEGQDNFVAAGFMTVAGSLIVQITVLAEPYRLTADRFPAVVAPAEPSRLIIGARRERIQL